MRIIISRNNNIVDANLDQLSTEHYDDIKYALDNFDFLLPFNCENVTGPEFAELILTYSKHPRAIYLAKILYNI